MSELEKRKKLLLAESEVYRELLKLELYNVRIAGIKAKQKLNFFNPGSNPLLMMSLPLVGSLFFRRRPRRGMNLKGFGALALVGLQLFRRFRSSFGARRGKRQPTAAEDYLSKRI